jgi:uncharacterized damage-inducible protein DinB
MTTKDYFIEKWMAEAKTTTNAFKAIPADKADYRPHPKTRSAREIVDHLIPSSADVIDALEKGQINHDPTKKYGSMDAAIEAYNTNSAKIEKLVAAIDEKTWNEKMIPFHVGGNKLFEAPLYDMCYGYLFDVIHHRGQLSTYYRPMGTVNPSIYGPTAETMEEMLAQN